MESLPSTSASGTLYSPHNINIRQRRLTNPSAMDRLFHIASQRQSTLYFQAMTDSAVVKRHQEALWHDYLTCFNRSCLLLARRPGIMEVLPPQAPSEQPQVPFAYDA
jgi:hypothetical protein